MTRGEIQDRGCLPRAPLRGGAQVFEERRGGVGGSKGFQGGRDAAEDNGQLVVKFVSGGCGYGRGAIGSGALFHAPIIADRQAEAG